MILSCSHVSKAFGTDVILDDISFHIEDYEKAAIVGINGAGKSTLLKIIVGELAADEGDTVLSRGKTLGYLAQHQDLTSHRTIHEELLEVKRPLIDMEERIRTLEVEMKHAQGGGFRPGDIHPVRGTEDQGVPGKAPPVQAGHHPPGRAHQPSGHGVHRLAGDLSHELQGSRDHRGPRPVFP